MVVLGGRVVQTPGEEKPYKVVLEHERNGTSEHPVASIQEGEALIKEKSPTRLREPKLDGWHL